jgi:hypothetical protein
MAIEVDFFSAMATIGRKWLIPKKPDPQARRSHCRAALPDSILSSVLRSVCGSPRLSCPNPYWLATSLNHSYASEGVENHITLEAMKVNDRTTGSRSM